MPVSESKDVPEVSYRVTITKITKNVPYQDREYKQIGKDKDGDEQYGYVYYDTVKDVTTAIYEQSLEIIDLTKIIKAVNSIG